METLIFLIIHILHIKSIEKTVQI